MGIEKINDIHEEIIQKLDNLIESVKYPSLEKPENNTEYVKLSIDSYNEILDKITYFRSRLSENTNSKIENARLEFQEIILNKNQEIEELKVQVDKLKIHLDIAYSEKKLNPKPNTGNDTPWWSALRLPSLMKKAEEQHKSK